MLNEPRPPPILDPGDERSEIGRRVDDEDRRTQISRCTGLEAQPLGELVGLGPLVRIDDQRPCTARIPLDAKPRTAAEVLGSVLVTAVVPTTEKPRLLASVIVSKARVREDRLNGRA